MTPLHDPAEPILIPEVSAPSLTELTRKLWVSSDAQRIEVGKILADCPGTPSFCCTREVMALLGTSRASLFRKIARGELTALPLDCRSNYFRLEDVLALMQHVPVMPVLGERS